MMNLSEYRRRPTALSDFLPWAGLVAPGVVLNKDGSFQRSARFRGPDLDSAMPAELVGSTARLNNALKRLGSGWAMFVEAARHPASAYAKSEFPEGLSWLIDRERCAEFESTAHFESSYTLTLVYLPPGESQAKAGRWMIESQSSTAIDWREQLSAFVTQTDRFLGLLEGLMPEIAWLTDAQTLEFLHAAISSHRGPVQTPEVSFQLDALLTDCPITGGLAPLLGDQHLRVLTVRGFPSSTWPGILDELNRLPFGYRWMTRFIFLDKPAAERELVKLRRQWFAKRKSIMTLLRETLYQQESPLVDPDADNKAADADAALQELGSDAVSFGYVTATVVLMHADAAVVEEQRKAVERVIQGRGFVTIHETFNAVEAWLSSIPGHTYANVRQPLVSTLNLAHLIPLSAVWAGPDRNAHLDGPPLIITRTDGATSFRLVTHVGDVGHTLIVGPTGAGKSVLLALLMLQFRRYAGSQVFAFDTGGSLRASVLGLGGQHYDLGEADQIAFQPLARIEEDGERGWAAEWLLSLFSQENLTLTPDIKEMLWSALASLATAPARERTLTGLAVLLQSNRIRQALQPYTLQGPYGRLVDSDEDRLGRSDVQCFEMHSLMQTKTAVLPILTYLFHRLEDRFDGRPTLLILDEAWMFLDDPYFASRIREWLKTLRKRNVSVVFATQSLSDIQRSKIAPAIVESCASRIFLPSPQATEPQLRSVYESFGLNARQIELIARATPKQDYYFHSRMGARLFELALGPVALAFAGAASPEDHRVIDQLLREGSGEPFGQRWLRHKRLDWAADLLSSFHPAPRSQA